jgi:hypothetical protein
MAERRKKEIDVRAMVARLNKEGSELLQREIIAPLLPGGRIRTRLGGMIHEFKPGGEFMGWGRFRPLNEREAEVLGEALPWERGGYLELFPALRVVLLWADTDPERPGTWWGIPFNKSDARQRFGFNAEPLPILFCDPTNGAERFERVVVRVDGNRLWFDGPDMLADPTHAEWLRDAAANIAETEAYLPGLADSERQALIFWRIRQIEIAEEPRRLQQAEDERRRQAVATERRQQKMAEVRRQNRQQQRAWLRDERIREHLQERLEHALAKGDARLHSYSELTNPDGSIGSLVVEWSEHGQTYRYRSNIDARMNVVSSGICLSGQDRDFDLTSLVHVMTDR